MSDVVEFELPTNDSKKILRLTYLKRYDRNLLFRVQAKSGEFLGAYTMNFLDLEIAKFISRITDLSEALNGIASISDSDSESNLTFELLSRGQVKVGGLLGGSVDTQSVKFAFETDQTVLLPLKNFLTSLP